MFFNKLKLCLEKWHLGLLIFAIVLAAVIRGIGLGWGMPANNLHPDEGIIFSEAYQHALDHSFEVRQYYRPNHVSIKINTLLYMGIQELYFVPQGHLDFAQNYNDHFALFTVASRVVTLLFGVGTVILAYLIMLNLGKPQALFAGYLFAVFPSFIEHSHYITPDVPLLFFLMAVLLCALNYLKKPTNMRLFAMAFFTAAAFCEKYPGIYGCVIIAAAVILTYIKKPWEIVKKGLLAIFFVLVGIMAISPILLVDFRAVLETLAGQNKQYHLGADGLNFGQTVIFYCKMIVSHLGLILSLCSVYGIINLFKKDSKKAVLFIVFFAYLIPISMIKVHWERYTLPLYAACLMLGGSGILELLDDLGSRLAEKRSCYAILSFILVLLPLGSLTSGALAFTGKFLAPDSRICLQKVFEEMNVNKNNTVCDCNTPLDPGGFYGAFCNFEDGDPARFKYGHIQYVMTSSAQRDLYLEEDQEIYGWIANFYRKLDDEYSLIYQFPVENPECHFLEIKNIWCSVKSVYRYLKGAATGFEIRLYQMH